MGGGGGGLEVAPGRQAAGSGGRQRRQPFPLPPALHPHAHRTLASLIVRSGLGHKSAASDERRLPCCGRVCCWPQQDPRIAAASYETNSHVVHLTAICVSPESRLQYTLQENAPFALSMASSCCALNIGAPQTSGHLSSSHHHSEAIATAQAHIGFVLPGGQRCPRSDGCVAGCGSSDAAVQRKLLSVCTAAGPAAACRELC